MAAKRLSFLTFSVVALIAASAAWLTGGALTVTSFQPDATTIGLLPSPNWLAVWLVAAFLALAAWRSRSHRFTLLVLPAALAAPWIPLPGAVPAALYIWAGPLRIWLWTVVLVGLLAPTMFRRAPSWLARTARDPQRAPWLAAAIAAAAYLAGAYQISPQIPTGDEPHYLVIAQSLINDHDLQIENNHRRGDYREFYAGELKPDYLRRGVHGEIYSVHAPGLAAVVAPALALFGYPGVLAFLALISAWATSLAWTATWRVTSDAAASWFGWAAAALSAPFFFQSFVVYPDAPGAALVMVGVLALVDSRPLTTKRLVATGAALALLPWLHTRYAVAAAALGVMILAQVWTAGAGAIRRAGALMSVPLASAACWFAFFYVVYGSPDPRAPYGGASQSDIANLSRGIIGLLFDQQFGVLPVAPVLLCALAGLLILIRQSPRLAAALVLLIAPYGFVVGAYQMWWGGNSSPGRFIIPVMLPLAIPAGVWFHSRRGHAGRLLGLGALTVSLLTTATLAGMDRGILLYNFRDGSSRLLTWLSPLVNITSAFPSVFQTTPSAALMHGLVWIGAIGLTAAAGVLVERRGATPVAVALSLGFAAMTSASLALSIVWWDHGIAPWVGAVGTSAITPAAATSVFLRRFDPDSGQMVIRYGPARRVRTRDVLTNLTLAEAALDPEAPDAPAVALLHVPAGAYAIEGAGWASEPLTVTVDSAFGPQWMWHLDKTSDAWRHELRLPVPVRAMAIKAPGARRLAVRPVSIPGSSHAIARTEPDHVARYGPTVVYLMNGNAFMEPGGTWVEGGQSADFVISTNTGAPMHLLVRNPPVANAVTLASDGWRQHLVLAPGEERLIALPVPPAEGATRLRITAAHGARPTEFERGSTDSRYLGCWIEIRP